ncbi:hypothetical protein ACQBAR_11240 [Propionibacteriaceae bacterium Y1685]
MRILLLLVDPVMLILSSTSPLRAVASTVPGRTGNKLRLTCDNL